ncbi:ATP-grasp domain-containing protein [Nocardioides ferulae]|uniref:ATP-grasp domain-containing protein n=1 Tax=Nocardioides ferulae TaxID=2340821 RepID=UPI000EAC4AF3|nr:hypothetical protein [Nocardioides ferulae]
MENAELLLATCRHWAAGEPGHAVLDAALERRGIVSRWAVWDDPFVDWSSARMVAVRSTWDYDARLADFLGWAGSVGPGLLHGVEAFRWNTDKSYLLDLARTGLPVVPTLIADNAVDLRGAIARMAPAVVKPRVGAGGRGIVVVYDAGGWLPVETHGAWVVQPLVTSVMDEGEASVFVIDGKPVSQLRKVASRKDIRVQERYGGTSYLVPLDPRAAVLAVDAIAAATEVLGVELVYGRVDMLRHEGKLVVGEVEITEPGLYLDHLPENADRFAEAVLSRLRR